MIAIFCMGDSSTINPPLVAHFVKDDDLSQLASVLVQEIRTRHDGLANQSALCWFRRDKWSFGDNLQYVTDVCILCLLTVLE